MNTDREKPYAYFLGTGLAINQKSDTQHLRVWF